MSSASLDHEEEITGMIEVSNNPVIESLTRGEIDQQIRTAKHYPRSLTNFIKAGKAMVQLDQETAEACIYSMPRAGKPLTGPSVRFAEIVLAAWGNSRAGYRPIEESERHVTAQGVFVDLENNTAITTEVRRGIVMKNGRRFNDDMINVTMNAAGSIAFRNAVLRGIPQALWRPIYDAARQVAIGNAQTLEVRRRQAVEYFTKMGVTVERVLARLEREGIEDVNLSDLETLTGLKSAIKEGATIEQVFLEPGAKLEAVPAGNKAEVLASRLSEERGAGEEKPFEPFTGPLKAAREMENAIEEQRRSALADAYVFAVEELGEKQAKQVLNNSAGVRNIHEVESKMLDSAISALNEQAKKPKK